MRINNLQEKMLNKASNLLNKNGLYFIWFVLF